jgi:hypothetical protein
VPFRIEHIQAENGMLRHRRIAHRLSASEAKTANCPGRMISIQPAGRRDGS